MVRIMIFMLCYLSCRVVSSTDDDDDDYDDDDDGNDDYDGGVNCTVHAGSLNIEYNT